MTTAVGEVHHHYAAHASDLDVLDSITSMPLRRDSSASHFGMHFDPPPRKRNLDTLHALRRPPIDPIVLAASLSSGPHVTRHHFHHSFGPKVESKQMSRSEREMLKKESSELDESGSSSGGQVRRHRAGSYANCDRAQLHDRRDKSESSVVEQQQSFNVEELEQGVYFSKQAPRSERLRMQQEAKETAERVKAQAEERSRQARQPIVSESKRPNLDRQPSAQINKVLHERRDLIEAKQGSIYPSGSQLHGTQPGTATEGPTTSGLSSIVRPPPINVRCYARTRIPTPHGEIFCHLYRNNRDNKEHLALVIDTAQNAVGGSWESGEETHTGASKFIRSKTLDEVWGPHETEMERIVRGAYVGRLGPNYQVASQGMPHRSATTLQQNNKESPLVRIHSECYTGETIGSQRCDCGEQLDEAIRLIHCDSQPARGVVVYLRQEGRGIGLLDKLMAYNLQDMGHDTVSANILLGHLADARKYDVAAEILRDLGVSGCRLLTNNPEKMEALESEGITVQARVPMIPRVWRHGHMQSRSLRKSKTKKRVRGLEESIISQMDDGTHHHGADEEYDSDDGSDASRGSYVDHVLRRAGATLVGGSMTRGPELEKYLRTKVERMGHLLDVPASQSTSQYDLSSSVRLQSDEGSDLGEAPLTDEEPLMSEKDLQLHLHQDEDDEDNDEILIKTTNN